MPHMTRGKAQYFFSERLSKLVNKIMDDVGSDGLCLQSQPREADTRGGRERGEEQGQVSEGGQTIRGKEDEEEGEGERRREKESLI